MWHVYMLESQNGAIYTGLTDDIERRFAEHVQGKGGHYTNCNRPVKILYHETFANRIKAEQREQQIKRWGHQKKLALIKGDRVLLRNLSKSRE